MNTLCCWCSVCGALWFFLAFESGRSEEQNTPNWSKYEPNPSKVQPGGPLGGAGGVKTAAGGKGTKKTHIFDTHRVAFGAFSVPPMSKLVPFWTPLDFEGVQKGSNFVQNQYKVWKNYDQERFQKKHQNLIDFRCQNKKHKKVEKRFSHDTCCVLRGFAGSRNSMKNGRPNVMKNPWKLTLWVPFGWIVEILGGFYRTSNSMVFMIIGIDPKMNKNL